MDNLDLKCSFGVAIISVLIYLLLTVYIFPGSGGKLDSGEQAQFGQQGGKQTEWYRSLEFMMFVSVFAGYNLNQNFLKLCKN